MERILKYKVGVSEIVASMLLLLIILAIGSFLYLYLYQRAFYQQQVVSQEITEEEFKVQQQLTILFAVGSSLDNKVTIIFATGPVGVKVYSIYVNNTLVEGFSSSTYNPTGVYNITVTSPITLVSDSHIIVRIVFEGGIADAWGEVA